MKKETVLHTVQPERKQRGSFITPLLCLLLILAAVSGFGFAKMQAQDASSDSSRVAALVYEATGSSNRNLVLNCNDTTDEAEQVLTASYSFTIANTKDGNTAEVSMQYDVIVEMNTALPDGITVTVDDITGVISSDRKTISFSNTDWKLDAAASESKIHVLKFEADPAVVDKNAEIGLYITARFVQIN